MKNLYWIHLWVLISIGQTLYAQCPPPGFPEPGNTCPLAPVLCENLDGYCSTINNNNQVQSFPGCGPGWTLNNDEWFAFFAGTTSITIQVTPVNCEAGNLAGLQGGIYAGCGPPWTVMDVQCPCSTSPFILSANNFEVGHIYWFVLDGCNGQVCDYTIDVLDGSTVGMPPPPPGPVAGPAVGCQGFSSSYSIAPVNAATAYTWSLTPPIGTLQSNANHAELVWNGSGPADLCVTVANGCYASPITSCTTVDVHPRAAAVISGGGSLCQSGGNPIDLQVHFVGDPPWQFNYALDGIVQAVITTSDNPYVIHATQAGTYTLKNVSSLSLLCPGLGTVSGSAVVSSSAQPDWVLRIDSIGCGGGLLNVFYRLCNQGAAATADSIPVTFYRGDPTDGPAVALGTYFLNGTALPGECKSGVWSNPAEVVFPGGAGSLQRLFGVVNDNASITTPFSLDSFPVTNVQECDYSNNLTPKGQVYQALLLDIGPDGIVCKDSAWTFAPWPGFFAYRWQDGSTASTFTASTPGIYWVEATDACGFRYRDTAVLSIQLLPALQLADTAVCPGATVQASAPAGFAAYEWAPAPGLNCTSCPSVSIQTGVTATYTLRASDSTGCVARDTFLITVLPQPAKTETFVFCPGKSVTIGGTTYTQPGTVLDTLPSTTGGCDTLATYQLQFEPLPQPSNVSIQCPANLTVQIPANASTGTAAYTNPTAGTDCPCGVIVPVRTQGPASGAAFPAGATQVCYRAADDCGNSKSCCFTVTVENMPAGEDPCDVKNTPCLKFEILGIFQNPAKQKTYRMRLTNNCPNELVHVVYQLPDGLVADKPVSNSGYTSPAGRSYEVRNPNFSPFYSIRFKSTGPGIASGQSDIFEYTLPPQADPLFIHTAVRLAPQIFIETHLNVFACEVQQTQNRPEAVAERQTAGAAGQSPLHLYPNPTTGLLNVDLSAWEGEKVLVLVRDALGGLLFEQRAAATAMPYELALPGQWSAGLYLLEVRPAQGPPRAARFVVQR